MKVEVRKERCPQNHECPAVIICPTKAIRQREYKSPVIDNSKCIKCGRCVKVCYKGAFILVK